MRNKLFKRHRVSPLEVSENLDHIYDSRVVGPTDPMNPPRMTEPDREKLGEMTRALSEEEMLVVLENIPAELCIKRIELELKKARAFGNAVEKSMRIME